MLVRLQSLHGLIKARQINFSQDIAARLYSLLEVIVKGEEPRSLKF